MAVSKERSEENKIESAWGLPNTAELCAGNSTPADAWKRLEIQETVEVTFGI